MLVRRLTVIALAFVLLPWVLPTASATVTAGTTAELVNPEQRLREMSSAVPIFGFSLTADTRESLFSVNITFTGVSFDAGDDRDIATLSTSSATSGIGIYRDDGSTDDVLDAGDSAVALDDIGWSGADVLIDLSGGNEILPATTVGSYTWFIVLRSSNNSNYLHDGDRINGRIYTNTILATDAGGLAYQPASDVITDALIVRFTRSANMVLPADTWIGPAGVQVHEAALLGLRIVDGGGGTNSGVNDWLAGLQLELATGAGTITSDDFAPIVPGAGNGIALYLDDGTLDDVWDSTDTPINLGSISPSAFDVPSPVIFSLTLSPALAIPDDVTGNFDLIAVVRTGTIVTGDAFHLRMVPGSLTVNGVLSSDAGHTALYSGWTGPSSWIFGDDTPPTFLAASWTESSYYLGQYGDTLYFNNQMPPGSNQDALLTGWTADFSGSGTRNITWSNEPGLAASPATTVLGRTSGSWSYFSGIYSFNASSTDTGSPVQITAYDWVGNMMTASQAGFDTNYEMRTQPILFDIDSGWYSAGWPTYIDDSGTLWFSDKIYGSTDSWLGVTAVSLYGGGIRTVSAAPETSIGGPSNPSDVYAPGYPSVTYDTAFTFWPNSTTDGWVTVSATDQAGNSDSMDFAVRKDTTAPAIQILEPTGQNPITGNFLIRANVTDVGAGVSWVEVSVDPDNGSFDMTFDGTNWYWELPSNTFSDGPHSIVVMAGDRVNNERAATVNVMFGNGVFDTVAPHVSLFAPGDGAKVGGTVTVSALATDNAAVASVWVQVGAGAPQQAIFNSASGRYEFAWDSSSAPDGTATITVTARDTFGNEASASARVSIDNTAPSASISGPAPAQELAGTYVVRVYASDAGGVQSVKATIEGRTVDLAYNPSSGYYEYTFDTKTMKDGTHSLSATVTDASGQTTTTQAVEFKVQNGDTWRGVRESSNFLFLLFAIVVVAAVLILARRGVIRRWMTSDAAVDRRLKDENDKEKKERVQSP